MLKFLRKRKNQKRIFIILAIIIIPAFLYWGSASVTRTQKGQKNYAGIVSGRRVSFEEYLDNQTAVRNKLYMQFGSQIHNIEQYIDLNSLVWERIILLDEAKRQNIKISNPELVAFIKTISFFQKDGKFDQSIYEGILQDPLRIQPREFEEHIRQDIMINILFQNAAANIKITDADVLEAYKKENKKFNAKRFEAEKTKCQEDLLQKKRLQAIEKFLIDLKIKASLKDYITKKTNPSSS